MLPALIRKKLLKRIQKVAKLAVQHVVFHRQCLGLPTAFLIVFLNRSARSLFAKLHVPESFGSRELLVELLRLEGQENIFPILKRGNARVLESYNVSVVLRRTRHEVERVVLDDEFSAAVRKIHALQTWVLTKSASNPEHAILEAQRFNGWMPRLADFLH